MRRHRGCEIHLSHCLHDLTIVPLSSSPCLSLAEITYAKCTRTPVERKSYSCTLSQSLLTVPQACRGSTSGATSTPYSLSTRTSGRVSEFVAACILVWPDNTYHHLALEYRPDVDITTHAGCVLSPDPAFIHTSVHDWICDNSLEWVTAEFSQLGIYEHQDLVNVACGLRSPQFRQDLLCALDPGAYDCATLETALRRYARPIDYPFVRSSNVTPRVEQSHEYLFNAAAWHQRLLRVQAEIKTRHQEREVWIDSMIEDGGVEEQVKIKKEEVKVKKEEVKVEDMEQSISGGSDISHRDG